MREYRDEHLRQLWATDLTVEDIARVFDVTTRTISVWRRRLKLPPRQDRRSYPTTMLETLLHATRGLSQSFTPSQLAVAAWRLDPDRFGLKGFETAHPDVNRVVVELVGKRTKTRYFERVAPSTYRLTEAGRYRLARLLGSSEANGHA